MVHSDECKGWSYYDIYIHVYIHNYPSAYILKFNLFICEYIICISALLTTLSCIWWCLQEKTRAVRELTATVLARAPKMCNFIEWQDKKVCSNVCIYGCLCICICYIHEYELDNCEIETKISRKYYHPRDSFYSMCVCMYCMCSSALICSAKYGRGTIVP